MVANAAAPNDPKDTIRARKLEIVDDRGRVRMHLRVDDDGPVVELFDKAGSIRAYLGLIDQFNGQPGFGLATGGEVVVSITLNDDGDPCIHLEDAEGAEVNWSTRHWSDLARDERVPPFITLPGGDKLPQAIIDAQVRRTFQVSGLLELSPQENGGQS